MKATIDIPDGLYRQVKARAALDGRTIRDVSIELYTAWLGLELPSPIAADRPAVAADWLARWQQLGDEVAHGTADPRPVSEIVLAERR